MTSGSLVLDFGRCGVGYRSGPPKVLCCCLVKATWIAQGYEATVQGYVISLEAARDEIKVLKAKMLKVLGL